MLITISLNSPGRISLSAIVIEFIGLRSRLALKMETKIHIAGEYLCLVAIH